MLLITGSATAANFQSDSSYAWGSNFGWVNFRHDQPSDPSGVIFGEAFLSGYAYAANIGWIYLGSGMPANGYSYSNVGNDHGVNHDGAGNLSGYAWGANIGWINFGWASAVNPDRPRVSLSTGDFSGYAYAANLGWLQLGTGILQADSMALGDSDGDGIPDFWEYLHFGALTTAGALTDFDGDGVSDYHEYLAGTDPKNPEDYFRVIGHAADGGLTDAWIEFTSVPSRLYAIEISTDLGLNDPWQDPGLGVFSPDNGASTYRSFTFSTTGKIFYRAAAVRPLSP